MDMHRSPTRPRGAYESCISYDPLYLWPVTTLIIIARVFRYIFWLSTGAVFLDFVLNLVWLPIGAHETYGLRTAEQAFMTTYNGTGAPAGWNWCLSYLATAGILIGFDASGHVAEETKNASLNAAKGIFWSTVISGILGFSAVILFLFASVRYNHYIFRPMTKSICILDSPPLIYCFLMTLPNHSYLFMLRPWVEEDMLS
jgi:amino acid transporter